MERGSTPAFRALPEASGRGVGEGPVKPTGTAIGRLHPLGLGEIVLAAGHELGDWQRRNSTKTLPHCIDRVVASGAVRNLERVAQGRGGEVPHEGMHFSDSDVYKVLEAVAWDSRRGLSGGVEDFAEEGAAVVARAQRPGRLPQLLVPGPAPRAGLERPALGPRALLCRPPAAGGGGSSGRAAAPDWPAWPTGLLGTCWGRSPWTTATGDS